MDRNKSNIFPQPEIMYFGSKSVETVGHVNKVSLSIHKNINKQVYINLNVVTLLARTRLI